MGRIPDARKKENADMAEIRERTNEIAREG